MDRLDQPPGRSERRIIDDLQIELEKLDSETRELLMMRFYGGFSFRELAKIRSEPIGTTLSKVHRGLKKLKEQMEQNND
jgi:RNA polymerase sigma-70 factor (ECF subfamily)